MPERGFLKLLSKRIACIDVGISFLIALFPWQTTNISEKAVRTFSNLTIPISHICGFLSLIRESTAEAKHSFTKSCQLCGLYNLC